MKDNPHFLWRQHPTLFVPPVINERLVQNLMWISPEFKVYLIREFQRLKFEEQKLIGWTAKRELSKINYRIHTDAIKNNLIPAEITPKQANIIYADEADVLNVAMFGMAS